MPRLDCDDARALLGAFEDDELDGVTSLAVQTHLEGCAACRAHRAWDGETRAALRRLRDRETGAPTALRMAVRRRTRRPRARWAAVAGLAVLAGIGGWSLRPAGAAEPREFVHNHVASLHRPDAVHFATTDATTAEAWLLGQLPFALHLPRQAPPGYRLAGVRLCAVGRQRVGYALYRGEADEAVSLFIGPAGACTPTGLEAVSGAAGGLRQGACGGTPVAAWEAGGMSFVVAGALGAPELRAFAQQEVRP